MAAAGDIVDRFADLHMGFSLIDFESVGLPFFELRLDVMAQMRHELPIIDEYLLRSADLGLRASEEVGGFLGLQPALIKRSVLSLLQSDYVDYAPARQGREIALTQQGRIVLADRTEQVPERTELRIGFDRLLWKLSARWMKDWEDPRTFKHANTRLVSSKLRRRPEAHEVDMVLLNHALADLPTKRGSKTDQDVIQILNVGARTKYLPALLLVYVADDQSAIRASFIIDEHHSPEHDRAFADQDGLARLGIGLADRQVLDQDRPELPTDLEALRPPAGKVEAIDQRLRSTTAALGAAFSGVLADQVADSVTGGRASTRDRLQVSEREVHDLRLELEGLRVQRMALPLRPIPTYEHRLLLEDALDRTQRRLLIIAPWVRSNVVDGDFISDLERLCRAGVHVHVGYGIKRNDTEGHDAPALGALEKLARMFPNFTLRELGHTHAKVLVWDDSMVVTSFNWLSFRGDRSRQYRQEEGTFISDADYVNREYDRHRADIESA